MDTNVLVGILGVAGTILAPIITLFIKRYLDQRPLKSISAQRRKSIEGRWKGKMIHQNPMPGWPPSVPIEIEFSVKRKKVFGTGKYKSFAKNEDRSWNIDGGFRTDRYLLINYQNTDPSLIHFGSVILRLASNGKTLKGNLVGHGPENEDIVSALIDLEK